MPSASGKVAKKLAEASFVKTSKWNFRQETSRPLNYKWLS
jgi:hypothetical protein